MLFHSVLANGIVEIREVSHKFTVSMQNYWYYDTKEWKVSSFGRKDDEPDRDMRPDAIEYFKKFHLPKLNMEEGIVSD